VVSRSIRYAVQAGAVAAMAVGGVGIAHYDKAVTLSVDGQTTSVHVLASTVGDLLAKQGVTVGAHDLVVPATDQPLDDGETVVVRYGRQLSVTTDGRTTDYSTTAGTVGGALGELGLRADAAQLSVSRSEPLGRAGLAMTMTNPRNVTVTVDWATFTRSSGSGLGVMDGQYTGPIGRRDIDRLLCDSTISRVIMGPDSKPLDVGRSQRAFTDPQRNAIIARDQGCGWAGCEIPGGWCEVHHHTHWEHGGPTCIENGCLLCPYHHRFLHRHPNWTTTFINQILRIYRPDGRELTPNPWNTLAA